MGIANKQQSTTASRKKTPRRVFFRIFFYRLEAGVLFRVNLGGLSGASFDFGSVDAAVTRKPIKS